MQDYRWTEAAKDNGPMVMHCIPKNASSACSRHGKERTERKMNVCKMWQVQLQNELEQIQHILQRLLSLKHRHQ